MKKVVLYEKTPALGPETAQQPVAEKTFVTMGQVVLQIKDEY